MNRFDAAVAQAIEDHRETVNAPTRAQSLLIGALAVVDGFKLQNTTRGQAVTESEWLALCREAYWRARFAIQKGAS